MLFSKNVGGSVSSKFSTLNGISQVVTEKILSKIIDFRKKLVWKTQDFKVWHSGYFVTFYPFLAPYYRNNFIEQPRV